VYFLTEPEAGLEEQKEIIDSGKLGKM